MSCRHCGEPIKTTVLDLGTAPPSNAYLRDLAGGQPETWYPLRVVVCTECWLMQTEDFVRREELFAQDYAYLSGASTSWSSHCRAYAAQMIGDLELGLDSRVVEVASNDGTLLREFKALGIPCLGVEPTGKAASIATSQGIDTYEDFFDKNLATELVEKYGSADLMVANNVLAHVPDVHSFVRGFTRLLSPHGVVTFEFPHVLELCRLNQIDTVYHEHFSYLSLLAANDILKKNGLQIYKVEKLVTHGGSLRVFAQRIDTGVRELDESVATTLVEEEEFGLCDQDFYKGIQSRAVRIKMGLLRFLLDCHEAGSSIGAYGAAAKGNTLLNYAGIKKDLLPYIVDRNKLKQGCYAPGSRIPIVDEETLRRSQPKFVLILPWNLRVELTQQLSYVRDWGGKFVVAVPELEVF